jgi:hypothetical protein
MSGNRRDFIRNTASMTALAGLFAMPTLGEAVEQAIRQANTAASDFEFDPKTANFWGSYANAFLTPTGHSAAQPKRYNETEMGIEGPDRTPFLFHYGKSGFQAGTDVAPSDLLDQGDVNLRLNLEKFRPSQEDRGEFENLKSAQLRIDVMQTKPILDWIELLAWSAVAGVFPDKSGKLPPLSGLGFDPKTWQQMQNLALPGGEGQWALNLAVVKKESWFMSFLQEIGSEIGPFAKVMGMPAVSVAAFSIFTALYGKVQSTPKWVFNQGTPLRVFATKQAYEAAGEGTEGLPLTTGNYVVIPQSHVARVTPQMAQLTLAQGYLVPKNTNATQVAAAAAEILPDVTYATLNVEVAPKQMSCAPASKEPAK